MIELAFISLSTAQRSGTQYQRGLAFMPMEKSLGGHERKPIERRKKIICGLPPIDAYSRVP
jgi:hypothetical protein